MLVYRIEDEHGNGVFRTSMGLGMDHSHWFLGPAIPEYWDWNLRTKMPDNRYRYVFGMDSLQNLLDVFKVHSFWATEDLKIPVSIYEADRKAARVVYSYQNCSKQVIFDREYAELREQHHLTPESFCGRLFDSCPPHLRKPCR